jgi:hypothetical protein
MFSEIQQLQFQHSTYRFFKQMLDQKRSFLAQIDADLDAQLKRSIEQHKQNQMMLMHPGYNELERPHKNDIVEYNRALMGQPLFGAVAPGSE